MVVYSLRIGPLLVSIYCWEVVLFCLWWCSEWCGPAPVMRLQSSYRKSRLPTALALSTLSVIFFLLEFSPTAWLYFSFTFYVFVHVSTLNVLSSNSISYPSTTISLHIPPLIDDFSSGWCLLTNQSMIVFPLVYTFISHSITCHFQSTLLCVFLLLCMYVFSLLNRLIELAIAVHDPALMWSGWSHFRGGRVWRDRVDPYLPIYMTVTWQVCLISRDRASFHRWLYLSPFIDDCVSVSSAPSLALSFISMTESHTGTAQLPSLLSHTNTTHTQIDSSSVL